MTKKQKVALWQELTEDDLEMIYWRATRGCHYEGSIIMTSEYGIEVIEKDVPRLIAEIRRLKAAQLRYQPTEEHGA